MNTIFASYFFRISCLGLFALLAPHASVADELGGHYDIGGLRDQIAHAVSSGQKKVVIRPGIYRGRVEGHVFITIRGAKNLEVDARGVTLICEKRTRALEIQDCAWVAQIQHRCEDR